MSSNIRWIYLSYALAALAAVYFFTQLASGVMHLAGVTDPLASAIPLGDEPLASLIGLIGGIVTLVVLLKHPKATPFGLDVVKEIKKVTWPTIPETRAATLVVIVLVMIIGFILGIFDWVFSSLTGLVYL